MATGRKCITIPKDEFPELLRKFFSNLVKWPENLITGFMDK
jgi:hypothetical protein